MNRSLPAWLSPSMDKKTVILVVGALALWFVIGQARAAGQVSSEVAHTLVEKQGALLLDVRTPEEFAEQHLAGALNVPVQELEARLASLPAKKDQDIVVYCRSGARSARAAAMLTAAGFTRVHDLGGMSHWQPCRIGSKAPARCCAPPSSCCSRWRVSRRG